MSEQEYWVGFNLIPGIGRAKFALMEKHFSTLENAWSAGATELKMAGLEDRSISAILTNRPNISLDAEMEKLERYRIKVLTWNDADYPKRLKEIYDLPPVLYVRGSLLPEDEWAVAVVGTRRTTIYGREAVESIVGDLAQNRITIVSGLAKGIDAIAHRAALDAGGRTVAVMGCGLDMVYPPEHVKLAREIIERGALVSDYPMGTQPRAENFPRRNRILSGLSLGVLVVEAGETSGALITASWALEQNREVFAVPGSILSPSSRGTNKLIQEGAKLVMDFKDILEELNLSAVTQQLEFKEFVPATDVEAQLLKCLSTEPVHIDEVRRKCSMPVATVSSTLAIMELKGMVRQVGGMNYILSRERKSEYEVKVE